MPLLDEAFDAYMIWYLSGFPWLGKEAQIQCYQGTKYVGMIVFYKDDSAIPPNEMNSDGIVINYGLSRFNDIISILRQEKPLYLRFSTEKKYGAVATSKYEPVGEEESKS
jgi:hypothetical protein